MHDKAYLKEQIHKIILYCISHQFDRPLSPKLLLSPTAKDFRHLMLFFFQQVDPNYAFGPSVEEDIKRTMKLLGYPFALSKNALQAAGTPHTWPALLLMMAWIVDVLNYDDKVEGGEEGEAAGGGGSGGGGVGDVEPHPEKLFFAYLTQSYAAFIQGNEQQTAQLEEQLANTFGHTPTTLTRTHTEHAKRTHSSEHDDDSDGWRMIAASPAGSAAAAAPSPTISSSH